MGFFQCRTCRRCQALPHLAAHTPFLRVELLFGVASKPFGEFPDHARAACLTALGNQGRQAMAGAHHSQMEQLLGWRVEASSFKTLPKALIVWSSLNIYEVQILDFTQLAPTAEGKSLRQRLDKTKQACPYYVASLQS